MCWSSLLTYKLATQGELLERVSNIKGEVKCLTFKPSGSHLAIGFDSGELHVYEWPSLKLKFCLK